MNKILLTIIIVIIIIVIAVIGRMYYFYHLLTKVFDYYGVEHTFHPTQLMLVWMIMIRDRRVESGPFGLYAKGVHLLRDGKPLPPLYDDNTLGVVQPSS